MPSCSADQSDENDSRNGSVESYLKAGKFTTEEYAKHQVR